ncbi:DUF7312 domain-containing protein [Natrarchaeobaculum aegyptiacum]|uniref:DUF7312 domain-containing protein n=1 Tax=Natrarchaeobaculum aegyptiacum TaxID=745377 RepID=A0A2Z2HQY8_9EURY|nr:hypothetical protein [Natrarchaeobaculum aegyptiacum]ARS89143.1 hypothetical protein B1756_04825 [Natrarchaeobaculum aegyptiacum]
MADESPGFDRDDEDRDRDPGRTDGTDPADDAADRDDPTTGWTPSRRPVSSERDGDGWTSEPDVGTDEHRDSRPDHTRFDDADRIRIDLSSDDSVGGGGESSHDDDPRAPEPSSTPIEAGDPSLENVLFVILGAVAMILVIVRFVSLPL